MKYLSALVIGAIFGVGIVISGMGNPAKVQNFFDLFGSWDPSLAFVMGGALLVFAPGYFVLVRPRRAPVLEPEFRLPRRGAIDARLVGGSAVFGIGWGIVGFCPGGAIPMIGTLDGRVLVFIGAMLAGMLAARFASGLLADRERAAEAAASG
ncbi:MAG: YeeE/YedE family protein [Rhizobium sp.]|nr:YeeE/YedE family protein [Rhizobium sp.]